MRNTEDLGTWVIYRATQGDSVGTMMICQEREWQELQARRPGVYQVVQNQIVSENDAERLARGSSGDTFNGGRRSPKRKRQDT